MNDTLRNSIETILSFFLCGVLVAIGNVVGYGISIKDSLIGVTLLAAICVAGFLISKVPLLNKLPMIFWISIVGIILSTPLFPWYAEVLALTKKVQFIAVITPILAYAGLAVGKDIEMFKKISWRIIPVALCVFAGTFLFAAILAHFTLHWGGVY